MTIPLTFSDFLRISANLSQSTTHKGYPLKKYTRALSDFRTSRHITVDSSMLLRLRSNPSTGTVIIATSNQ